MDNCLNCETELEGNFCVECGQRATSKRFTVKTLWDSEFLEQNFSLTRGLPKTLLSLLYRPGKLAREYVAGKRKRYFPFVGLFLLLAAADAVIRGYADLSVLDILAQRYGIHLGGFEQSSVSRGFNNYFRLFALLAVPVVAFFQWLIIRKLRWNFWEHCVAVFFLLCAQLWTGVLIIAPTLLPLPAGLESGLLTVAGVVSFLITMLFYQPLLTGNGWGKGLKAFGMAVLFFSFYSSIIGLGVFAFAETDKQEGGTSITIGVQ